MPRESITMYAPPYALRMHDAQPGHGRGRVRVHELGAVADHAPPLEVAAGLEAGRVDERDDRQVERVAPRDEAGRLARRLDVERARAVRRLVGDDADRPAVERRERGHEVRRVPGAQLEARAGVERRRRSTTRTSYDAVGRSGNRRGRDRDTARSRSSSRLAARRIGEVVVGEVRQERDERVAGRSPRRGTTSAATPVRRSCTPLPPSSDARHALAGEVADRVRARSRTRTRRRSSRPGRSSPSASAGPDTHAPVTASSVGHDARDRARARVRAGPTRAARRRLRRAPRPTCRARRRAGSAARPASCTARSTVAPPRDADRAVVLAARDAEPHDRAGRRSRAARPTPLPSAPARIGAVRSATAASRHEAGAKINVALWPPNPNEFDSAGAGGDRAGRAGDDVELDLVADAARGSPSAEPTPSRIASRHATASVAPAAPMRWPVTPLVDVTGGARLAEHLADRLGFGRVVERRRGAVRVHVADRRPARGRRRRARVACTRPRLRRRATAR